MTTEKTFLLFIYGLAVCLVAVFVFNLYELVRGWRIRCRRPYVYLHHDWRVEILKQRIVWYTCRRCGAVGIRAEAS